MRTILDQATHNGVAKKMNESLDDQTKSMRIHFGLPKTF